jgi:hypothetical protein
MNKKQIFGVVLSLGLLGSLSGCATTMAGAAGQALAGSAATGAVASGGNRSRFARQNCDQLQAEIAGARRAMINPMTIPSTQAYIRDARAVAVEKDCAFVADAGEDADAEVDAGGET